MWIQFVHPTPAVRDIEVSKQFYSDVLGLEVVIDDGPFVLFEGHFSIHTAAELMATVYGDEPARAPSSQGSDNLLLYFETSELDEVYARVRHRVNVIHPVEQQPWGQRVFRFHDPDGHIVEVGEPMARYASWVEHLRSFARHKPSPG